MKTAKSLSSDLNRLTKELDRAEADLTSIILEGRDARTAQAKRDRLRTRTNDLAPAISEAQRLEAEASDTQERNRQAELRTGARQVASAFISSAKEVDDALENLEATISKLTLHRLDLEHALRACDHNDGKLARAMGHSMRWAVAENALNFADMTDMPRVPTHRRLKLVESIERLIPSIPE